MKTIGLILSLTFLGCGGEPAAPTPTAWYVALGTAAPTCQGRMDLDIAPSGAATGDWYCIELVDECETIRMTTPDYGCLFYNGRITGNITPPHARLTLEAYPGATIDFTGEAEASLKWLGGTATFGTPVPFAASRQP